MKQIPVNFAFSGKVANIEFHGGAINGIDRDKLIMFSASKTEDGVFVPANSFTLYGSATIKKLRDALLDAYPLSDVEVQS